MDSTLSRWLMAGIWLSAVAAMVCGSVEGAGSTAALWSLPAALVGTMALIGWPGQRGAIVVSALVAIWELALIGAWWPFASRVADDGPVGPMHWPLQSLLIGGLIAVLLLSFLSMFLLPGIGLSRRLGRAMAVIEARLPDHEPRLDAVFAGDIVTAQAWLDYKAHWLRASAGEASGGSRASARDWFDLHRLAEAKLRLEFFRHLPGMFTGLGIIGTFTGLILGLRSFRIASDPAVVQHSLERLLGGVWEAFLVSAMAITLSIAVTILEKMLMSALSRRLERVAMGLDRLHPPRVEDLAPSWLPGMLARASEGVPAWRERAASAFASSPSSAAALDGPARAASPLIDPVGEARSETPGRMTPMPRVEPVLAAPEPAAARVASGGELPPAAPEALLQALEPLFRESSMHARASAQAIVDLAQRLPAALGEQHQSSQQVQQQSLQVMKALASRLEGLASSIELGGRRTLEGVASRLMQSELDMVARHHAVTEHLVEVVQRVEVLCGLLQRDRSEGFDAPRPGAAPQPAWPAAGLGASASRLGGMPAPMPGLPSMAQRYDMPQGPGGGMNGQSSAHGGGESYGFPMDDDIWGDPPAPASGGFGS